MKNFFNPTKVTWIFFSFFFGIIGIFWWVNPFFGMILVLPMVFLEGIGLPVESIGYFGFMFLPLLMDVFVLYLFASLVSYLWYKLHPKPNLPETS